MNCANVVVIYCTCCCSEAERQDSSDGNMKLSSMIKAMEANSSSTKAIEIDEQRDGMLICTQIMQSVTSCWSLSNVVLLSMLFQAC